MKKATFHLTNQRLQVNNLDALPIIDRSLIDYNKYHKFIGHAGVKYSVAIQATRGCTYKCFYCDVYKTAKLHRRRSVENLFKEIRLLADIGIKRIEFIDDIFNVNKKDFTLFFELVLKHRLDIKFFFPTGLRGDLLTKELIDLMVEAGAIGINLALEHPSHRIQKIMRKNLDIEKLHENLQYITEKYPFVILVLNAMHGFPTETEEEALETLAFIQSIKWIHFPYLHNVVIFPGTELERFAIKSGIPKELIIESQDMSYHEASSTLPFSQNFTNRIRTIFLRDYVLNRERLLHILPYQLEQFSEDELNQKYNGYFPTRIKTLDDLLRIVKIDRSELRTITCLDENLVRIPDLNIRVREKFPLAAKKKENALRIMFLDLSAYFSHDHDSREYDVFEPPLGLMALQTYINREFGGLVAGKIYKSRIDFDTYEELYNLIISFSPDIIGIRTLSLYKSFFHKVIAYIRERGISTPIIAGGPYASASYEDLLQDKNVCLAVIGEGEITLAEIIEQMLTNNKRLPEAEVLKKISGIAFVEEMKCSLNA